MNLIDLAERNLLPDSLIRIGIRRLLRTRIKTTLATDLQEFASRLRECPVAVETQAANQQHYEVPAAFFELVLGPRLKYSSCLFNPAVSPLSSAEEETLRETCARAEIEDGMRILELGCGWGSLTLWIAEHYPACEITAVSNSASQRQFIETLAAKRGLKNVSIITADMQGFDIDQHFERVISVEMFEHMRNFEVLFQRVSNWLTPTGKAFVHVFCHRETPYLFESDGAANWMGRHFFTGGMMPSEALFAQFETDLTIEKQWRVNGLHYWRTCESWLSNLDRNRKVLLALFQQDLAPHEARLTLQRWRIFFMACAELFRYRSGEEWFVAHYLFQQTAQSTKHHSSSLARNLQTAF